MENSEDRLSPSERRTLQHLAEGELHASELDWVAVQRLKRLGLAEMRGQGSRSPRMASAACSASYPEPSPLRVMVLIQRGDTDMAAPTDETEPLVTSRSTQPLMCNNASRSTLLLQGRASHPAAP